ncbi:zinc metalloprotease [Brevibacterium rongguiense]|uniref:hypothetical protein n=1 Tax=Brevibacterium rongguiense TaxID=2695267 RepID=UPI002E2C8CE3|nr:hypothetical protein [Brevibacterium rongguiense]
MPSSSATRNPGAPRGLVVGRVFGAPIVLAWSWFVAAVVITVFFAPWIMRMSPGLGWPLAWGIAFGYAVLLFSSVFLHELAHAVAGRASGQQVAGIELNIWGGFTQSPRARRRTPAARRRRASSSRSWAPWSTSCWRGRPSGGSMRCRRGPRAGSCCSRWPSPTGPWAS